VENSRSNGKRKIGSASTECPACGNYLDGFVTVTIGSLQWQLFLLFHPHLNLRLEASLVSL
jgi:hypothetical protein